VVVVSLSEPLSIVELQLASALSAAVTVRMLKSQDLRITGWPPAMTGFATAD
jgi:hypothetical protein